MNAAHTLTCVRTHTHTHAHTPVGIFTTAISACQDLHHQVPKTSKASEKLQRDDRITDKTGNNLICPQTQGQKFKDRAEGFGGGHIQDLYLGKNIQLV